MSLFYFYLDFILNIAGLIAMVTPSLSFDCLHAHVQFICVNWSASRISHLPLFILLFSDVYFIITLSKLFVTPLGYRCWVSLGVGVYSTHSPIACGLVSGRWVLIRATGIPVTSPGGLHGSRIQDRDDTLTVTSGWSHHKIGDPHTMWECPEGVGGQRLVPHSRWEHPVPSWVRGFVHECCLLKILCHCLGEWPL